MDVGRSRGERMAGTRLRLLLSSLGIRAPGRELRVWGTVLPTVSQEREDGKEALTYNDLAKRHPPPVSP